MKNKRTSVCIIAAALAVLLTLCCSTAAAETRSEQAKDKVHLGNTFLGLANNNQAAEYFREALKIEPNNADAWAGLATALCRLDDNISGIDAYRKAIRQSPQRPDLYLNMGICYERLGDKGIDEAISAYKRATVMNPQNPTAWNQLGTLYQRQTKTEEAISAFQQAIKADENFFPAYNNLGAAMFAQKKYAEAIRYYQKAIQLNPDLTGLTVYSNLGLAFLYYGDLKRAEASFIMEIVINPDDQEAHLNLANILALTGRLDEAVSEYYRVLSMDPLSRDALFNMGVVYLTASQPEAALKPLSQLVEFYPDDPAGNFFLGKCLLALGRSEKAAAYLERARKLGFEEKSDSQIQDLNLPRGGPSGPGLQK